jgi:dihydroorotate dehydrogenase
MYSLFRPFLFRLDAERAHHLAIDMLTKTSIARIAGPDPEDIEEPVKLFGLTFRNRVGLAAGFDKNALAINAWHRLGFGFIEIGTVTQHAQQGNDRPRIFRCPKEMGVVNRMGFPNEGADAIAERVKAYRSGKPHVSFPIAVNLGKSKITDLDKAAEDYLYSFRAFYDLGDFFVVNVSSPNTPGLRSLQHREGLVPILQALQDENKKRGGKPILLKIAPDLTDKEIGDILSIISEQKLDGIVATNTTLDHSSIKLKETGGLSGAPVRKRSNQVIRFISRETTGKLPIIGVGGVFNRADYLEKLEAGASLVEVYTGFIYEGPRIVGHLLRKW